MNKRVLPYRTIDDGERELIEKQAKRGSDVAKRMLQTAEETETDDILVSYTQHGNFTIATVAVGETTYSAFKIIREVSGATKRHPDDPKNEERAKRIAISRAVKGDDKYA